MTRRGQLGGVSRQRAAVLNSQFRPEPALGPRGRSEPGGEVSLLTWCGRTHPPLTSGSPCILGASLQSHRDSRALFSSSVVSLCDPMDRSTPGFTIPQSLLKLMPTESVMPSNHLTLCRPLLLLPRVFPSINVFSSELALGIRGQRTGASASVLLMSIQG